MNNQVSKKPLRVDFILVGPRRRVGKDTLSDELVRLFHRAGVASYKLGFAEALRNECDDLVNAKGQVIDFWRESDDYKERFVRPVLLAYGQARTAEDPKYWAKRLLEGADLARRAVQKMRDNSKIPGLDDIVTFGKIDVPNNLRSDDRLVVVVPDWRKVIEAEHVKEVGERACEIEDGEIALQGFNGTMLTVAVSRKSAPPPAGFETEHAEHCYGMADIHVHNDGTLEELSREASKIVAKVLGKDLCTAVS